jgi:hypothetical protein
MAFEIIKETYNGERSGLLLNTEDFDEVLKEIKKILADNKIVKITNLSQVEKRQWAKDHIGIY